MQYSFYNNSDRIQSLIEDIKNRSISTKHLYIENGAKDFYKSSEIQLESSHWVQHYISFFKKNIKKNIKKNLHLSLLDAEKMT